MLASTSRLRWRNFIAGELIFHSYPQQTSVLLFYFEKGQAINNVVQTYANLSNIKYNARCTNVGESAFYLHLLFILYYRTVYWTATAVYSAVSVLEFYGCLIFAFRPPSPNWNCFDHGWMVQWDRRRSNNARDPFWFRPPEAFFFHIRLSLETGSFSTKETGLGAYCRLAKL